jgi:hypothetical protein
MKSYVEKRSFTSAYLPTVRVIMVTMHIPLVELLCQFVMEWTLAFECLLLGARGCL